MRLHAKIPDGAPAGSSRMRGGFRGEGKRSTRSRGAVSDPVRHVWVTKQYRDVNMYVDTRTTKWAPEPSVSITERCMRREDNEAQAALLSPVASHQTSSVTTTDQKTEGRKQRVSIDV